MKYVMIEVSLGEVTKLVPIIFPDFMTHSDIAKSGIDILVNNHKLNDARVVSAGDVDMSLLECSGVSETLNIAADDEDSEVINSYDYTHGIGWSTRPLSPSTDRHVGPLAMVSHVEDLHGCKVCGASSCYHCQDCGELCWEHKEGCVAVPNQQGHT